MAAMVSLSSLRQLKPILPAVALFWDLTNNPPQEINPYDAAIRLKLTAARFGPIKFAAAYGTRDSCSINLVADHHLCHVCGRRFYNQSKLLNHFKQVHEREQAKRIAKINSAKGGRRIRLIGDMTAKIQKFWHATEKMSVPTVGTTKIGDEIRRAGICLNNGEIRAHVAAAVEGKALGCLVVVSEDKDLEGELRKARMRGLKTIVVGEEGGLRRIADLGFSWREVVSGKAGKQVVHEIGRWKDRDLLRRLEWTHQPGKEEENDDFGSG